MHQDLPGERTVCATVLAAGTETAVVIASRGRFDEEAIEQALATNAGYVALVAGKKRVRETLARLENKGTAKQALERVRARQPGHRSRKRRGDRPEYYGRGGFPEAASASQWVMVAAGGSSAPGSGPTANDKLLAPAQRHNLRHDAPRDFLRRCGPDVQPRG
jgi:hypothetical protein